MSDSMGTAFVVTTSGESHGPAIEATVDGCPRGLSLCEADLQPQLDRRRPGQSRLTTPRSESDQVEILSGVVDGVTIGESINLRIPNRDTAPGDYKKFGNIPRPSHADLTYKLKYGAAAASGGGRASARETVGRVAAAGVAEKLLSTHYSTEIVGWVRAVGGVDAEEPDHETITRDAVDMSEVRCPDAAAAEEMAAAITSAVADGDSVGGVIECVCRGVPPGWGEPVFGKLDAMLAAAMLSIPASKGFEIGSGFGAARMRGSEHNDMFVKKGDRIGTLTNRSGGVQGGITNGEPVVFRVAFKPTATISLPQETVDYDGNPVTLEATGRHDPCVVPRAVAVVEAMAALVLADAALLAEAGGPTPGR